MPDSDVSDSRLAVFKAIVPFLAGTVFVSALGTLALLKFTEGSTYIKKPVVVTFDTMKYTNSARAVASTFLKQDASAGEASALLLNLPERVRASITKIAGKGTLVMLKQAVVQGQSQDITTEVLKDLGLPTEVATLDDTAYSLDTAPTNLRVLPNATKPYSKISEPAATGEKVLP